MIKRLKPGIAFVPKIKSSVNILPIFAVVLSLILSSLACAQQYISPNELTAVAKRSIVPPHINTATSINILSTATPNPKQPPDPTESTPVEQNTSEPDPDISPTSTLVVTPKPPIQYHTQIGDNLPALAARFNVSPDEIISSEPIPKKQFINPGTLLTIPDKLPEVGPADALFPDSEIVYSPTAVDFDIKGFIEKGGGYLSTYREYINYEWYTSAEAIELVALEYSINPRILLSLLEYQSHWVFGQPTNMAEETYPLGWIDVNQANLYKQLKWAASQLSAGYYGWRDGTITELVFPDKTHLHLAPGLNAGSVAVQYLFAQIDLPDQWHNTFYATDSLLMMHEKIFGDPWMRDQAMGPLFPPNFSQPTLELPFAPGHTWNFTGGPHEVWGEGSALAAIDFAPIGIADCTKSDDWVTSVGPGVVVRSSAGIVVVDMDGDGYEQTGWTIFYLHIADDGRIPLGTLLKTDDKIGHPSCEGGNATGTHTHIARKYNGEWMLAGGPMPFVLSGWEVHAGKKPYEGTLVKNEQMIEANDVSSFETRITRPATNNQ